jgi:tRNA pseudouridine55 synthase
MDGILNINKPPGNTSFSIVAKVKRLSGERRVGHAGTLDPAATGVLPVCLGQGTRVIEFLMESTKTYRAQIELGVATDTYDATGKITQKGDPSRISQEQFASALASFCGLISQIPPMYSAVKHHGQPLYKLARAGITVERKSRLAKIYHLELIDWRSPVATVEVECGKGTYIRSLAHDLGQSLGCGANLKSLIRLRHGFFDIKDAITVPQLEDAFRYQYWQHFVYPIDIVLLHWAAVVVDDDTSQAIMNGHPLILKNHNGSEKTNYPQRPPSVKSSYCRVYTPDGGFLGVLHFNPERGEWQPKKIFPKLAYG